MQRRQGVLLMILMLLLMAGFFVGTPVAEAIGKITPTPDPAEERQASDDGDAKSLYEAGLSKIQEEDYEGAIADFSAALRLDARMWDAYFFRAFSYAIIGHFELAIDDYTRALEIRPYDYITYALRANVNFMLGEFGEAGLDYEQAIFLGPRYEIAYRGRSQLNLQNGKRDLSVLDDYIARGLQESANGNVKGALDFYSDALDAIDKTPPPSELGGVYYNRAVLYITQDKWDEALTDLDQAIELQPDMQDYYMLRGYVYSSTDDLVNAAPDFYQRMRLLEQDSIHQSIEFDVSQSLDMQFGRLANLTFSGESGQQVTITARETANSGFDPLLVLLAPDGKPIAGNDDGGGNMDSLIKDFTLTESGIYTIVVSHANGGYEGLVDISLQ